VSVTITFRCGGCGTSAEMQAASTWAWLFGQPAPGGGGLGTFTVPRIPEMVPDGWIFPDPYTGAPYCPSCWATITQERAAQREETTDG
jgi:hypothetical protein